MLRSVDDAQRQAEVIDHLTQLASLRQAGILSEEEFEAAKARLLGEEWDNEPAAPRHWFRNLLIILLVLLLAAGGFTAVAKDRHWWVFTSPSHTLAGRLDLDASWDPAGNSCTGGFGYFDLEAGDPVTVTSQTGVTIGSGLLSAGTITHNGCQFTFAIPVQGARFYTVTIVGLTPLSYSDADLTSDHWAIRINASGQQ